MVVVVVVVSFHIQGVLAEYHVIADWETTS